jgi:cell division protein FtsN
VQVSSTTDAIEAELEREWFAERGQSAFVMPAEVGGTRWQRVLVGRYATRAEAEASLSRLRDLDVGVP